MLILCGRWMTWLGLIGIWGWLQKPNYWKKGLAKHFHVRSTFDDGSVLETRNVYILIPHYFRFDDTVQYSYPEAILHCCSFCRSYHPSHSLSNSFDYGTAVLESREGNLDIQVIVSAKLLFKKCNDSHLVTSIETFISKTEQG